MLKYRLVDEILERHLLELKRNVNIIERRIDDYPQELLMIKTVNNNFYYRLVDKNTRKQKYIRSEDIHAAKLIAQRDYDYSYLRCAKKEIKDIEDLLAKSYTTQIQSCYSDIHEARKILVNPFEVSDEEYIKEWMQIPYTPKEFKEDDETEYYTDKGERVRSKSEIIIANLLNSLNIPYKYECPLRLKGITIYPDFTVLDVKERREKYMEHFGMMGDAEYVSNTMKKLNTYEQNGIFLGDSLICSFETVKRPINVKILKDKLTTLL